MRRRPVLIALMLAPLLLVPACIATRAILVANAKVEIERPSEHFPLLLVAGAPGRRDVAVIHHAQLSRYRALHPEATFVVPPGERAEIEARVRALRANPLGRVDESLFDARVDFDGSGLTQRTHVSLHQEVAMGTAMSESWYETDGTRLIVRAEREYFPSWMHLGAFAISVPVSLLLGALAVPMLRRARVPELNSRRVRMAILITLYALLVAGLSDMSMSGREGVILFGAWFVYWVACLFVLQLTRWSRRTRAMVLAALVIASTAAMVIADPAEAEGAPVIAILLTLVTASGLALVWFLEKCLGTALRLFQQEHDIPAPAGAVNDGPVGAEEGSPR